MPQPGMTTGTRGVERSEQKNLEPSVEPASEGGRSARKHQAIMEAATALFLRDGYRSTSMDQIAADAAVSKQTVYKHFQDKEQLFREIVLGVTANSEAILEDLTAVLYSSNASTKAGLLTVLTNLARRYVDRVLDQRVLSLRRLIIAEAEQFPDLARTYYEQAPARGMHLIAGAFLDFQEQGLLKPGDVDLAAAHFAYLALAIPQDKAQFCPNDLPSPLERTRLAEEAARVFLAAYGN